MAKNNQQMVFEVTGDVSGLKKALGVGQESLNSFGKEAGGIFGEFGEGLEKVTSGFAGMSTGLVGAAAGAGIAVAGISIAFDKVTESAERAFEIFQSASLSQMGIAQVQKMAQMYQSVGLSMERIADQQKDIKDRIGDALTNLSGSMYTDVIQPLKLNVLELQKMAANGEDVYAKIYFAAKAQGLSVSQMVNMFETMGNDATKRLTVLKEYNSEQEYNNTLTQQQVALTEEQSAQFQDYRNSMNQLTNAWQAWENSALAPVASRLAEILNLITSILNSKPVAAAAAATSQQGIDAVKEYSQNYAQQNLANSSIYGQQMVDDQLKQQAANDKNLKARIDAAQALQGDLETLSKQYNAGFDKKSLDAQSSMFQSSKEKIQKQIDTLDSTYKQWVDNAKQSVLQAYSGDAKAMEADIAAKTKSYNDQRKSLIDQRDKDDTAAAAKAKAASDKAARDAATAATKAAAKAKKLLQDQRSLDAIMSGVGSNDTQVKMQEFNRQYDEKIRKMKEFATSTGKSNDQIAAYEKKINDQRLSDYKKMIDTMIGYSDPNKGLKDQNDLLSGLSSGSLTQDQGNFLQMQQNQRVGLQGYGTDESNPYDNSQVLDQKRKDLEEQQQLELNQADILHQKLGTSEEEYQKKRSAIQAKYNQKILNAASENTQAQMQLLSGAAGDIGTIMAGAFGAGSKAAQAAFAIQKGLSIAQTVLSIQTALANALATPFPSNLANYASILSMGASIISTAKGAASGQAHSGIDSVPTMGGKDESTWILQAGERVLSKSNNKDLTQYLSNANANGGSGSNPVTVNAPLIIQGSTNMSDAQMNELLKKNSTSVLQSVRQAQKRNS